MFTHAVIFSSFFFALFPPLHFRLVIYMYVLVIFQVCVEGNIGSGKTTFLEYFKKFSNIIEVKSSPNTRVSQK